MLDKLAQIETRYEGLTNELSSPELLSNPSAYGKAAKQHRSLGEIVQRYRAWKTLNDELTGARELMEHADDEEMRELARVEIEALQAQLEQADIDLKLLLIPRDPNDEKNVILEIRAGTGGDEASLFASDILRMYARYAERQRWKMEILDASETGIGGLKEAADLVIVDVAVDKRDPIPMRTLLDHRRRQRPLLPGLANDREPIAANLLFRNGIECSEQVLESFEGPDHTEEQDIADRIA